MRNRGRGREENKTQEGTYRHAFPSKGCRETERREREVSVMLHETGQGTRNSSVGHLDTKHFQTLKARTGFVARLEHPKAKPQKPRN